MNDIDKALVEWSHRILHPGIADIAFLLMAAFMVVTFLKSFLDWLLK